MAVGIIAATLPIGEHKILGDPNSLMNLHLDTVLLTLLVCGVLLALGLYIRSHVTAGAPSRVQNAVEAVMQFLDNIIEDNLGRDPGTIASIALTLFFFIWVSNLIGLLPVPTYLHSPTADVNCTFALALLVFILLHARYIRTSGLNAYKGHYWTSSVVKGVVLNPLSVLLGIVNELSRPLTLAFRLFGNIIAGEVLLVVWAYLAGPSVGFGITAIWNAIFVAYGIFVGTIQAFIFTVLTVAYMAIASEPAHDH
ncbi:MAG TPA: F0F1 ATP synthase subunit A [Chloroflexota bacterium]|nr:F0F1 ATP synthase subunit A [Chloroflexota bacterium]